MVEPKMVMIFTQVALRVQSTPRLDILAKGRRKDVMAQVALRVQVHLSLFNSSQSVSVVDCRNPENEFDPQS